jgi:hypothetical protein
MAAGLVALKVAKLAGQGNLLFVLQRLVAKHQHSVLVHAGLDRRDLRRGKRARGIDPTGTLSNGMR